ncbi:MAG: hypothetical protein KDC86_20000 [Saprospiraceae bacterium]|nr:hypothetical protein [Saprospiraceae bacterium]
MTFSETTQKFKIGRMTYSLPDHIKGEGVTYALSFRWLPISRVWLASYRHVHGTTDHAIEASGSTFNKALKALHSKVKEHQK